MLEEKVSPEQAEKEINAWLDAKKVSSKKREAYKDAIDTITSAIVDGTIAIKEDKTIVHTLLFPLDGFANALEYKPRLSIEAYQTRMKGVASGDADGRIMAVVAGLAEMSKGLVAKMDTEDYSIAQAVAVFFL